jgi:hypothetical protein
MFIWYIFSGFGIIYQEKSGNRGAHNDNLQLFFFSLSIGGHRNRIDIFVQQSMEQRTGTNGQRQGDQIGRI